MLKCPKCKSDLQLLPLDGISQEEIDRASFLLLRCTVLHCDAGSVLGLLAARPAYLRQCGMLK